MKRILVAGVGNVFLGDDAFGVEVVQRLAESRLPDHVQISDFGIRGFDLAFALMDDYDATILVDTTQRGGSPGTLYVIEPDGPRGQYGTAGVDTHNIDPQKVLSFVREFGVEPRNLYVVGCEPATFGNESEGAMGLSEPVAASLDEAVRLVESLIGRLSGERARA